jgi:ABC-type transporter Mla MlaB component
LATVVPTVPAVMLKITLHDSAGELRFRLEGRLSGAWVGELRQCWQTAQSTIRSRRTTVDLKEVDYVDADGQSLLTDMYQHGVVLKADTPLIRELVQEIERAGRCATVEEAPAQRPDALVSTDPAARHRRAL